jgi:hypothetical protein
VDVVAVVDLVRRSGPLKREVLDFVRRPPFDRVLTRQLQSRFGTVIAAGDHDLDNFLDWFIQQYRRPDGRAVVDVFLETRPDLPAAEREFLLGWQHVVEGFFEVLAVDGDVLVTVNLIDELEYRIRANVGPSVFPQMPPGCVIGTRVVPVGDDWLLSGSTQTFEPATVEAVLPALADLAMQRPELVFRNPEKLAAGWELQRADRAEFVAHFGADLVVLDRGDLQPRLAVFAAARYPEGMAESWVAGIVDSLHPSAESAGLVYDEEDGLGVYADFGLAQRAFADPGLVRQRRYRALLKTYLDDDSVSPVPLLRLAEADWSRTDAVFRALLGKPRFRWTSDGEALLRSRKAHWYRGPRLPRFSVIGDRLAAHVSGAAGLAAPR